MKKVSWATFLTVAWIAIAPAQEMPVPLDVQYPLFLKIFTFDRNFKMRVGDEIVIGIAYQSKFRMSLNVKDELIEVMKASTITEIEAVPIRYVSIDMGDEPDPAHAISKYDIDILYTTPLRAIAIEKMTDECQKKGIMTLTGVPDYVESGIAVGIGLKGGKPEIRINLSAAKAEGVDFSSKLLKLAKIIE